VAVHTPVSNASPVRHAENLHMSIETLLVIILIVLVVGGGGLYGRGRWF
jgi:hypothetical protein